MGFILNPFRFAAVGDSDPIAYDFIAKQNHTVTSGDINTAQFGEISGLAQGDLLVVGIAYRDTPQFSAPSGWTVIAHETSGDNVANTGIANLLVAFTIRGASAPDYVFTRTAGGVAGMAIGAWRPATSGYEWAASPSPLDTFSQRTLASGSTVATAPAIDTADSTELLIAFVGSGDDDTTDIGFAAATDPSTASTTTQTGLTAPTNGAFVQRERHASTAGADFALRMFDAVKENSGNTGEFSGTSADSIRHATIVAAFRATPV